MVNVVSNKSPQPPTLAPQHSPGTWWPQPALPRALWCSQQGPVASYRVRKRENNTTISGP